METGEARELRERARYLATRNQYSLAAACLDRSLDTNQEEEEVRSDLLIFCCCVMLR